MPVPLRTTYQKAEAKYNVTTEFPSLGLHSAAATGNIGLVEYALDHGQPINSVLDGVLPLHAACAGGSEQVVKLLIEHGADVNAPRLPRRYSNDKNRDASAPIVGTSGSTPLHFAAANGNTSVVTILLLYGAHANRSDKHGITPEMLARQHGWLECADVLNSWMLNKDRDLREREFGNDPKGALQRLSSRERIFVEGEASGSGSTRKRLHMKQSLDTALNMLKPSSVTQPLVSSNQNLMPADPPTLSEKPFGEYTFHPIPTLDDGRLSPNPSPIEPGARRPSLPHIFHPPSTGPFRGRKTSTTTNGGLSPQQPGSTGVQDEKEQDPDLTAPSKGPVRKLGSKYSLMSLFKKAQSGDGTSVPSESAPVHQRSSSVLVPSPCSRSAGSSTTLALSSSPKFSSPLSDPASSVVNFDGNLNQGTSTSSGSAFSRVGLRFHRGSDASTRSNAPVQQLSQKLPSTSQSPLPLALPLTHDKQYQVRDRSGSSGSNTRFEIPGPILNLDDTSNRAGSTPTSRLGALFSRGHSRGRSGSGSSVGRGGSSGNRSGAVFDDDMVIVPGVGDASELGVGRGGSKPRTHMRSSSTGQASPYSMPAPISGFERHSPKTMDEAEDEDEGDYGQPLNLSTISTISGSPAQTNLPTRDRGLSFTSSEYSLSPVDDIVSQESTVLPEFPFSINSPPPLAQEESPALLRVPPPGDNRGRGDSMSSTSTTDSGLNPSLSTSGTTSGSGGSITIMTPILSSGAGYLELDSGPTGKESAFSDEEPRIDVYTDDLQLESRTKGLRVSSGLYERRAHAPLDININSISSHAQAEALVQRAQQDILEMAHHEKVLPGTGGGQGRTPLSAKLAAYGESLALERRLREEKQHKTNGASRDGKTVGDSRDSVELPKTTTFVHTDVDSSLAARSGIMARAGVERQHSLEYKSSPTRLRSRTLEPRRPSTAEGLPPRRANNSFSSDQTGRTHQHSRSASGFGPWQGGRIDADQELDSLGLESSYQPPSILIHDDQISGSAYSRLVAQSPPPAVVQGQEQGQLSRISSLDGTTGSQAELGPALCRVSTAPLAGSSPRGKRDQVRTATKLTRMGFSPSEQAGRAAPPPAKRFGAIKSLMQTFKGKS